MKKHRGKSNDRAGRVDEIYFAALAIESDQERREFVEKSCADDDALRDELNQMFALQEGADEWFHTIQPDSVSVVDLTQKLMDESAIGGERGTSSPEGDEVGKQIGNYHLIKRIGEGGGGEVYLAEQTRPMRRQVALKVIKRGMDTQRVISRFEAERQALAMMEHPNIAHVLNAGETESGRPYFVMELVHGIRITDYCDENKLDIPQRLNLFVQVCHAIQHAHQKGIIHRDIKPSNVLITLHDDVPMPKVIDFGIAKATSGDLLSEETFHTSLEPFVGTPTYMSPEQAQMSSEAIDTRSDIYSLGVLLYELLAGKTPFGRNELLSNGLDEMRRILCERDPISPSGKLEQLGKDELMGIAMSRSTVPARLISGLKNDLDRIVAKALEKERARRYDTANELALDVQRFLNHEPVEACAPSRLYRFRKLVRRNKVVFAAGTAVLLALIIGLGTATWMFLKASEAWANEAELRRQAEAREQLAEAVMLVYQGDYERAATLINLMDEPPRKPSLDGVAALRAVGEWLALQGRWGESADRFLELMEIDKLDPWGAVTLDYQACGVVLVQCGRLEAYRSFRNDAVVRFGDETNGDAAGRILKTCLLLPVDELMLEKLSQMGDRVTEWTDKEPAVFRSGWAAIPRSLWEYRTGHFTQAEHFALMGLDVNDVGAKGVTIRLLLALSCHQQGRVGEAQEYLSRSRTLIEQKEKSEADRGDIRGGLWYDWIFAQILLQEAELQIASENVD